MNLHNKVHADDDQINDLSASTGVMALAIFARTHPHDTTGMYWVESDGASEFIRHSVKKDVHDWVALFELWALTRDKSKCNAGRRE